MTYERMNFSKGEVIFRKDDLQFFFYEITSGSVGIYSDYGEASEKLLTELHEGQTFGELSLMDYRPRSATAVALSDTAVIKVDDRTFDDYLKEDPARLVKLLKYVSNRTRELTADYDEALKTVSEIRSESKDEGLLSRIMRFARVWNTMNK